MVDEKDLEDAALQNLIASRLPGKKSVQEVIRLARKGLWAEKHGVPLAKVVVAPVNSADKVQLILMNEALTRVAKQALAALPKE